MVDFQMEARRLRRRDLERLHAALENADWQTISESKLVIREACRLCIVGQRYPLHIALCAGAPESLTLEILRHFPQACEQQIAGERYPLHLSLVFDNSEAVIRAVLHGYPKACEQKERVHGCYPLHLALRKQPPVSYTLAREIFESNRSACEHDDAYSRLPLHFTLNNPGLLDDGHLELALDILEEHPDAIRRKDGCDKTPLQLAEIGTVPLGLAKEPLPYGWEAKVSTSTGRYYFFNRATGQSTFERQDPMIIAADSATPSLAAVGEDTHTAASRRRVTSGIHGPRRNVAIMYENNRLQARTAYSRSAGPPTPVVGQTPKGRMPIEKVRREYEEKLAAEFEKDEYARAVAAKAREDRKTREAAKKAEQERREAEEATANKIREQHELEQALRARRAAERIRRDLGEVLQGVRTKRRVKERELEALIQVVGPHRKTPALLSAKADVADLAEKEKELLSQYNEASARVQELTHKEEVEMHELEMSQIVEEQQHAEAAEAEAELASAVDEMVLMEQVEKEEEAQWKRENEPTIETEDIKKRVQWADAIQSVVDVCKAQVVERGDALLKCELTETHQMDAAAYEAVRKRCEAWLEHNRFTDHRNNPVKLADLIAAWVYSMRPGGSSPNYCRCGYRMKDGRTQPAASCSCPAGPRNFRIHDKFNSSMRGVAALHEAEPEYQWFHHHLNNAIEHLPGAKANQTLFRGQGDHYGQTYEPGEIHVWKDYKSTSTNPRAAEQFAEKNEDNSGVFFVITGIGDNLGASLSIKPGLSAWPDEDEILLPAGATFVVKTKQTLTMKRQGAGKGEGRGMKVTLKYLGQWWTPEIGRLTRILKGVSRCLVSSQQQEPTAEMNRRDEEENTNAMDISGDVSVANGEQPGLLEDANATVRDDRAQPNQAWFLVPSAPQS